MNKTNIIVIGIGFRDNMEKILRMYEKNTGQNSKNRLPATAIYITSSSVKDKTSEELRKNLIVDETLIASDKYIGIFCFDTIETYEKYDLDGMLKENSIYIDKIDEDVYGMTVDELRQFCNKSSNMRKQGSDTVILVDSETNKEYKIGQFEPRRDYVSEFNNVIEFSIYPVKKEQIRETEKVKISEYIQIKLKELNQNPKWLAKELNLPESSVYGKLQRDSFTAYDLIKIKKLFNLDNEELIDNILI